MIEFTGEKQILSLSNCLILIKMNWIWKYKIWHIMDGNGGSVWSGMFSNPYLNRMLIKDKNFNEAKTKYKVGMYSKLNINSFSP